jgi:hypothetical protein
MMDRRASIGLLGVGDHVKVFMPGESPWAIITATLPDGRIMARVDNHTVGDMHGYKYGDVATFELDQHQCWTLVPVERQAATGPRRI